MNFDVVLPREVEQAAEKWDVSDACRLRIMEAVLGDLTAREEWDGVAVAPVRYVTAKLKLEDPITNDPIEVTSYVDLWRADPARLVLQIDVRTDLPQKAQWSTP